MEVLLCFNTSIAVLRLLYTFLRYKFMDYSTVIYHTMHFICYKNSLKACGFKSSSTQLNGAVFGRFNYIF